MGFYPIMPLFFPAAVCQSSCVSADDAEKDFNQTLRRGFREKIDSIAPQPTARNINLSINFNLDTVRLYNLSLPSSLL